MKLQDLSLADLLALADYIWRTDDVHIQPSERHGRIEIEIKRRIEEIEDFKTSKEQE